MKAMNTLNPNGGNGERKQEFSKFVTKPDVRDGIVARLGGDVRMASRLISTIISVVSGNEKLQECDYNSILTAALYGEVGMGLSLALGEYGIIPYGKVAKFQLQVNGLKQLAIRSKAYAKIDCFEVYQGEFKGRDPRTREPIFQWIEDEDAKLNLPIVGYYAFYVLNDANNNFFNCVYWSHEKILKHADRYSPAFKLDKYRDLLAGKLSAEEVEKLQGSKQKKGSSPWYANPNEEAHIKMCKKTVLKQLLNDGLAPKSIQDILIEDDAVESEDDFGLTPEMPNFDTDAATGEVISTAKEVKDGAGSVEKQDAADNADAQKPKRRGRPPKTETTQEEPEAPDAQDDDALASFFGDDLGGDAV